MSPKRIRMREKDHEVLVELRDRDDIKELAVEEGIIDEDDTLTNEVVFRLALSHDPDPFARPEDEMIWTHAGDAKESIMELAGKNVPVHEAVSRVMEQMIRIHDIKINNE